MRGVAQPRWKNLGPLRAIELPASEGAPTIVCMHGYGANAQDLLPIGMELDLAGPARWIFPGGPLTLPDFGPESRAWFPIDEERIARLQNGGEPIEMSASRPVGFDDAIRAAEAMIDALAVPREKLILGGFSQGAMMAVELASRSAEKPLGLFVLSGTLVDEPGLRERFVKHRGLRFFQSHGSVDPILDFRMARRLHETLSGVGLVGNFVRFEGPHAVPIEAIEGLRNYLNSILPSKANAK